MLNGLGLVVATDLSLANIFMACRGSGVRVSLAPFFEAQSLTGFSCGQVYRLQRRLGYKSRSQLYKLMNDGWLDAHVHVQMPSGQRLLDVDGLQKTLQGLCQWRVDSVFLRR